AAASVSPKTEWWSFLGTLASGIRIVPRRIQSMADMTDIIVSANGPLRITGTFVIKDPQGKDFDLAGRTAISLCRCGLSANKPFCDVSHGRQGFQSICEARALPPS